MRSTSPSPRRLHRRGPHHRLLPAVAEIVDQATADDPGHVLVYVEDPVQPDVSLGFRSIDPDVHPFNVLAGFTAPPEWAAFGIRARGRAHHLDEPAAAPVASATTFLVDRTGAEASVLRLDGQVTDLPGPALGTIPDLCRRVLDLPTAPAPTSTALLWTSMWLDRVIEQWGQPHRRRDLSSSWGRIAVLHPAVHAPSPPDVIAFGDPASLITVARSHAAAASWEQLRRSPIPLALPDGVLDRDVALWMDDGFFARWTIGAFPSAATMATDLRDLLGEPLGSQLLEVVVALLE
jgi:hypothetical protein